MSTAPTGPAVSRGRTTRRVVALLHVACVLALLADILPSDPDAHGLGAAFGFYALYGFVACWLLVILAKRLRRLVRRAENHYGDDD
ncbi:MAG: hypothetical protein FJX56_10145 [Alphaproteobacteria bacterium]|nr:hypothetical protein [Alphaproteobacteria bacterium]